MENQHLLLIDPNNKSDYHDPVISKKKRYNSGMETIDKYKAKYFPVLPTDEKVRNIKI